MSARVVVTGLGPVWGTSVGMTALADLLYGVGPREVQGEPFSLARRDAAPALRQMDGLGRLAVAAARSALGNASFVVAEDEADGMALALGTGYGCLASNAEYLAGIQTRGTRFGNPIIFQNTVPNAATGYVAIATGIRGPNATFAAGRTAGAEAIAFGREQIQEGRAFAALSGSADQLSTPARRVLEAQSPASPTGEGRPFDRRRDGIVAREGACFAVLEDLAVAEKRQATIQAEIVGMGQAGGTDRDAPPLADAIRAALDEAGVSPSSVDLVVASANGSRAGDRHEARAILAAVGDRVPVTCPKAWLGEMVGAGAAFGLAAACLIFSRGVLPAVDPTFAPDAECPVFFPATDACVFPPQFVLLPVAGDDGTAQALLLRRYQP